MVGLRCCASRFDCEQVAAAYDFVERTVAELCECLAYLLCQKLEEVDDILGAADETAAQLFVLCRHSHRTGVGVAFAHHHAPEHYERACSETVFLGAEHRHYHHVASGLELAVDLKFHLSAQIVEHKGLLRLSKADFRGKSGIAYGACR